MSYQVLARKWRPQRFDDVIGQPAVTRTLKNALASGRIAQAFVFAGPRGVGKTTTARILARALNCVNGPTADPCGQCEACVEIAEGRDIDVLEIDAATHTGIDNVREVIISGLGIRPVRNRYKVFIIDEVHQLSMASFNALLKSIEEPPPHVIFMMATTELDKIPETVASRSQVYEFRTISSKAIVDQLRHIVDAEGIAVGPASLQLIARDAEGSMRDAESKLDQVVAFTGKTIAAEDVATVLGLVGRDLLLDAVQAVADEDAPAAFELAGRAVELGYDLRAVCRELSRVARDLLVLTVDPARIRDPEIAGEGERDRLKALAARFSREDLLRAFDLLTRADGEIRVAAQPRYHLEMALLRWIHLRKLVALEDLIAGAGSSASSGTSGSGRTLRQPTVSKSPDVVSGLSRTSPASENRPTPAATAVPSIKDALLAEIRKSKAVFYNTVVAQAQKIEIAGDRVTFVFSPAQRTLRDMFEQHRAWLEGLAEQVSGRKIAVAGEQTGAPAPPAAGAPDKKSTLREQALADASVQALLEVFPADIRDIEEI
ncbi:MAG: DNA polymerase III, subunit gamma and tau [Acidobacteria bacterium RIFCSPLOWO2_12_FULL_65_11]|nr:MAG: DNA polymerase III, subunit gamma and tau [Acidobacteria bacterium RIFCSPLOWO2_02_FULL_64_15]OFW28478.1 MAG: DNA polymerase III, subunit gamma and tau [Acidobacteria bacterium RIFCSPLOWO2_12_FULL_65_11]